jgi:thiol:disulfide interchange protein DsbD
MSAALALLGIAGGSGPSALAQLGAPPKFVKAAATAPKSVEPGKPFTLTVAVTIDKPYHIQSNPPKQDYIPTELEVGDVKGFKIGKVVYPKATEARIGDETLPVYEGTVEIKVPVTPDKTLKPGKFTLPLTLKFQGCNEKVCYPPTSVKTDAAITVGKAGAAPKKSGSGPHRKMAAMQMGGKTP